MFNRTIFAFVLMFLCMGPVLAQNPTCPTRPPGDNSNACASTAFVDTAVSGGGAPNFTQQSQGAPAAGATTITLQQHNYPSVQMVDFMTAGQPDGVTDNSADFAKLNDFCANPTNPFRTGVLVHLDALHYKVHDVTLNCNIQFTGVGGGYYDLSTLPTQGTVLDYSSATAFMFKWMPVGFPAIPPLARLHEPAITNLASFTSNASTSITPLLFWGVNNPTVSHVNFGAAVGNVIDYYGGNGGDFENIYVNQIAGIGILIRGDFAGEQTGGSPCDFAHLGDCSTRVDIPLLQHITMAGSGSSICTEIRGLVATVAQQHTSCENGSEALKIDCPTGLTGLAACPQFFRGLDVQGENQTNVSFDLSDYTDFRCEQCYGVGASGGSAPAFDINSRLINYSGGGGAGGGLWWTNGTLYNANNSCIVSSVSDVHIVGGFIQFCNFSNSGKGGVEFTSGASGTLEVSGVTLCEFNGSPGSPAAMAGVLVDSGATGNVKISPTNDFTNCGNGAVINQYQINGFAASNVGAVSLTSATNTNLTSFTLPTGTYECFGSVYTHPNTTTTQSLVSTGVSLTSGVFTSTVPQFNVASAQAAGDGVGGSTGPLVVTITTPIPVYLVAYVTFAVSTLNADGNLTCNRLF